MKDNNVDVDVDSNSDSEILNKCEKVLKQLSNQDSVAMDTQSERKTVEKRKLRDEDESDGDDFITVSRSAKRLIRSNKEENQASSGKYHEVSVSYTQHLPKQMAFAKLLKDANIKNVTRIRFKSPFKVLVRFEHKEDAKMLINCTKIIELGYKLQMTYETTLSYGIIKGVDLDLTDEEILNILEADCKIIAVKRLKRIAESETWVDSESVRVCFESTNLPPYVRAYNCRFRVGLYVFPVSQCSGCWQFGHFLKYYPSKKKICPKCGDSHENCDTKDYKCLNCHGNHFVLDKECPMYVKEKNIREIMAERNITYRKALDIVNCERNTKELKSKAINIIENQPSTSKSSQNLVADKETYSSVTSGTHLAMKGKKSNHKPTPKRQLGKKKKRRRRVL